MTFTLRILLCFVALCVTLRSQQVFVQDLDLRNFPQLHARLYAFDAKADNIALQPTKDRLVFDNLTRQTLGVISCQGSVPTSPVSTVFVFDGSKSRLIPRYRSAVQAWNKRVGPSSESAIVEYGYRPYLVRDFSPIADSLDFAMRQLVPLEGNNIGRALSDSLCGAFAVLSRAKYKKTIVLLLSAHSSLDLASLQTELARSATRLHVICIGMNANKELRSLVSGSGGILVDNCADEKITQSCEALAQISVGTSSCQIDWNTDSTLCTKNRSARFDVKSLGVVADVAYTLSDSLRRHLRLSPILIDLGPVQAGSSIDTSFSIKALGGPITISRVTSNNPEFEVRTSAAGVRIPRDFVFNINVRFSASDDYRRYARVVVISDACDTVECNLVANSTLNPAFSPLLESFVNNETVYAGSHQVIRWIGVPPPDSIIIEFSSDGGNRWNKVTSTASGLSYVWTVPDVRSKLCFLRVAAQGQDLYHYSSSFRIIGSDINPQEILCGKVRIATQQNVMNTNTLCNTSTTLLRIDSVSSLRREIEIASVYPLLLAPNSCTDVELRCLLRQPGLYRDTFNIYSNHGVIRLPVSAIGQNVYATLPEYVNIGLIPIGVTFDTLVHSAICKTGLNVLKVQTAVQDFPDIAHFAMPSQELSAVLTTEDPCKAYRFQFFCTQVHRFSSRVRVQTDSGVYEFVLYGEGICAPPEPQYGIEIPDSVFLLIGGSVDIPIRYTPAPFAYRQMKRPYSITLRFENSILFPSGDTPLGDIDGTDRVITIRRNGFIQGDTLAMLHFQGALGRVDHTVIRLESFTWADECSYRPPLKSGRVFLSNVCRAGGLRQFVLNDSLKFRTIQPNPAHEVATISFSLREKGPHSLILVDVFGRVVQQVFDQELESGEYESQLDLRALAPGDYYAVFITPTARISTLVGVLR